MSDSTMTTTISIMIHHSIHDIDASDWDELSVGLPFQSHAWYGFGEKVMEDCEPIYILAYNENRLAGRASFWVVHNEPLPQYIGMWRPLLKAILNVWPLLICRSPLANTSGILILAEDESLRDAIFSKIMDSALEVGRRKKCFALILDYLPKNQSFGLTSNFSVMEVPNPGMFMKNYWEDFDDYLASGNKKDRQHYKRTAREAEKLNIKITRRLHVDLVDEALVMIRNVEKQHGAPENPWVRRMLLNMEMVNGVFLTASMNEELVGCGLLLEDNRAQMATALGLVRQAPYVYLMLVYEGIKVALERKIKILRWGSGAYEVKRRLGFEAEDNGWGAFSPVSSFARALMTRFHLN